MEIRFATAADVTGILELLRQVGQVHHAGRPDLFRAGAQKYSASGVLALLNNSHTPIFVAAEEGEVKGYCFCQIKEVSQDPVMTDRVELYIDDLCVRENCRRQGIATALFEAVKGYARGRRCDEITLNVWACNREALAFYQKLGMTTQKIGLEVKL